jgi:ribosomal protein L11 methyltransferase
LTDAPDVADRIAPAVMTRAFVVTCPVAEVDVASDALWQLGVRAIEERAAPDAEGVELWTAVGDEPRAVERAARALGGRWPSRVVDVHDEASETWRDFATPIRIDGDLVILPTWLDTDVDASTVVRIEPGGAFGLGDHPTTTLSLRALNRLVDDDVDVLDVGCGTGVVAVTAALLQRRPVRAIDISSAAVEATLDNARRNGVADAIEVDTTALADIDGDYDVVVANILAPVLVSLAADLQRVTRGQLVISGVLASAHEHVVDALAPMRVSQVEELDGWVCLVLRHAADVTSP